MAGFKPYLESNLALGTPRQSVNKAGELIVFWESTINGVLVDKMLGPIENGVMCPGRSQCVP